MIFLTFVINSFLVVNLNVSSNVKKIWTS